MMSNVRDGDIDADVTIKIGAVTDAQLAALDFFPESKNALPLELREALRRLTPALPSLLVHPLLAAPRGGFLAAQPTSGLPNLAGHDRRSERNAWFYRAALRIDLAVIRAWVVRARCWAARVGGQIAEFAIRSCPMAPRRVLTAWTQALRERWEVLRARSFARWPTRWAAGLLLRSARRARLGRASGLGTQQRV